MVDSFNPRGGRCAPWNFAGRIGSPGIFNAWLPSCTPSGVLAFVNRTVYDLAGQVEAVVDALGNRTSFTYDANGNQETVKNPLGFVATTVYAPTSNRVLATVDPLGYRTTFSYDLAGQETGRQDARGNRITFAYDLVGRPRSIQNELGAFATTSYDAAGRPVTMLDANGWLKTLSYDAASQLVSILYADGTRVTMQYDAVGNVTTTQYLSQSDQVVSFTARNEPHVVRLSGGIRFTNTYDAVGNRTVLQDTSGAYHTYGYDALNRVSVLQSALRRFFTYSYDADSRPTTLSYGSGERRMAYDALGRVITQTELVSGSPILTLVDSYDAAGRKISQLRGTSLTSYTYDAADRLTGQQLAGANATYTMDAVGNLTVKHEEGSAPMTMTYNAASQLTTLLQGLLTTTYTYDANGNNTAFNAGGSRTTLAYDYENRMRSVLEGSNRSTLVYWANGLRRQLVVNGSATTYVWDGSDYLQARTVSDVTTYENVGAQILALDLDGSERLLVPDTLGSVVKLLDASGNETYDAFYWPYGPVRSSAGLNDTNAGYVGIWGYHADGSRRLYIRARVYDPVTGRWYTVDPLWPEESAYGYGVRRSVQVVDASGTSQSELPPILEDLVRPRPKPIAPPITPCSGKWPWERGWTPGMPLPFPKPLPSPRRDRGEPAPTERHQDYQDGWDPWNFNYGFCCGANRRCNRGSQTIDCLDRACRRHDSDNTSIWEYMNGYSHSQFCDRLIACTCGEYPVGTKKRGNCESARAKMIALYCLHGAILPWD